MKKMFLGIKYSYKNDNYEKRYFLFMNNIFFQKEFFKKEKRKIMFSDISETFVNLKENEYLFLNDDGYKWDFFFHEESYY